MKRPYGISFNFGIGENWWPKFLAIPIPLRTIRPKIRENGQVVNVKRFGIRLDFLIGTMRRPVPKIFKHEFWMRNASRFGDPNYVEKEQAINPWNSGNYWFILSIPWCPGIFFSACFQTGEDRQPGFYIGTKTYEVNHISSQLMDYATQRYLADENGKPIYTWAGEEEQGSLYLCASASLRSDLIEDK
jgi:hypothetical protein